MVRPMLKQEKGQALVEYVLIIALVSVLIIGLVKTFGGYLVLFFSRILWYTHL